MFSPWQHITEFILVYWWHIMIVWAIMLAVLFLFELGCDTEATHTEED